MVHLHELMGKHVPTLTGILHSDSRSNVNLNSVYVQIVFKLKSSRITFSLRDDPLPRDSK